MTLTQPSLTPIHQTLLRAKPSSDANFLSQVGHRLGIPAEVMQSASGGVPFVGPSGLLCRIHAERQETVWHAYAEILLPFSAAELGGPEVTRMLSLQAHLLVDLGWYLGLSEAGLLSLRPLGYTASPQQVADDLECARVLARGVLEVLVDDGTQPSLDAVTP